MMFYIEPSIVSLNRLFIAIPIYNYPPQIHPSANIFSRLLNQVLKRLQQFWGDVGLMVVGGL